MADQNQDSVADQLAEKRRVEEQRMACVHLANQRAKPDATAQDIADGAAALYNFVKGDVNLPARAKTTTG